MKRTHGRLLAAVLCLLFVILAGCQPTPETPVVVGKNDGDNKVTSLFGETSETEGLYEAPANWKEGTPITFAGKLTVTIDANITVPNVTKFPIVKVNDHRFTQAEADALIASLSEGNELFPSETATTREDKVRWLLNAKARLAELKAIPNPSEAELEWITKYEERTIPDLEAEIKAMPEGATPAPFTTEFQPNPSDGGTIISVRADFGEGDLAGISITNGSDEVLTSWGGVSMPSGSVSFSNRPSHRYWTSDDNTREITKEDAIPNGTSITREEALSQAEALMRKVGLTDMHLAVAIPASASSGADTTNQCWVLGYYPVVNGIPIAAFKRNTISSALMPALPGDDAAYNAMFYSPLVFFQIDDTGIWMLWAVPIDILETLNENAVLLPFDQIQERIKQQLPIMYAAMDGITEVNVTRVELAYMRARIKDTQDGYMLLPVWDVIGFNDEPFSGSLAKGPKVNPEDFLETLLTISALDGSVLDRQVGY